MSRVRTCKRNVMNPDKQPVTSPAPHFLELLVQKPRVSGKRGNEDASGVDDVLSLVQTHVDQTVNQFLFLN